MINKKLTPFRWCMLQTFPFIEATFDAIDNYQLLCKIVEYLNKNIDKTNELGIKVEELNNWFNNLDVQDEINKKLDEMAENGQLTDIIAQYLQLAGILAYNTVNEMKNAENLVNGSIARTLGEKKYNDGNGSFYKIRNITSNDVVDNYNIISLNVSNTLIAERIFKKIGDKTNPIYFGADPTGNIDSSNAINECIKANIGGSVVFTPGKYRVDNPILTPYRTEEQININFNGSTIFTDKELDYVLGIGWYNWTVLQPNDNDYTKKTGYAIFENLVIDAPNSNKGISINQNTWFARIINTSIFNTIIGIEIGQNNIPVWSADTLIDNVLIQCKSYKNTNTRGIVINGHDNKIVNSRIYNAFIGIEDKKGGNYFINDHIYLYGHLNDRETEEFKNIYPNTIAFYSNGGNQNRFESVYFDSYNTAFKSSTNNFVGSFLQCFHNTNVIGYDGIVFDFSESTIQALTVDSCYFDPNQPSENGSNYGLKLNPNQRIDTLSNLLNLINNYTQWITNDLLQIDSRRPWTQPFSGSKTFLENNYYKLGYIPVDSYTSYIVGFTGGSNPNKQLARIWIDGDYNIELNNIGISGSDINLGAKMVNIKNIKLLELSIMLPSDLSAYFGLYVEKDKSRNFIGLIPSVERHIIDADPIDYITIPSNNIGFEY